MLSLAVESTLERWCECCLWRNSTTVHRNSFMLSAYVYLLLLIQARRSTWELQALCLLWLAELTCSNKDVFVYLAIDGGKYMYSTCSCLLGEIESRYCLSFQLNKVTCNNVPFSILWVSMCWWYAVGLPYGYVRIDQYSHSEDTRRNVITQPHRSHPIPEFYIIKTEVA